MDQRVQEFEVGERKDYRVYRDRRQELCEQIQKIAPKVSQATIFVWGACEQEGQLFRQDSSFYYLTGIDEPGAVLVLTLDNHATIYVPQYRDSRAKWVGESLEPSNEKAAELCVDEIAYVGNPVSGYSMQEYGDLADYAYLIERLVQSFAKKIPVMGLFSRKRESQYRIQCMKSLWLANYISEWNSELLFDITPIVSLIRRDKGDDEAAAIYKAIEITILGHTGAGGSIKPGSFEREIQANIEHLMTIAHARCAFPSIVASGKNGTILHYTANNQKMKAGDLVVVDIGAEYGYYCGDLTRTYPVSGTFSKRQRELYTIVLETQAYIEDIVRPGYWLSNKDEPEKSLYHSAKKFLKDCGGYDEYFTHGIGHFLGLDVHDVGDSEIPLMPGDVITIEPGIYMPHEGVGIRIEDNYWLSDDGLICLSENLPKQPEDIEQFMKEESTNHTDDDDEQEYEYDDNDDDNYEEDMPAYGKKYSEVSH
ncbi:MAG TPA: aminopeptidase P N-terminal domain-containing protein [Candidatus Bathyarchaeia archaeon]|nr:aminopeptidase P N-terminal domain-containing protein [Candidatus Bathyarchaeia archaeon]